MYKMWKERFSMVKVQHNERNSKVYRRPLHLIYTVSCQWGLFAKLVKDMSAMGLSPSIEYQAEREELTVVIPNTEEGLKSKDLLTGLLQGQV